jgi:hypothetical protein
MLAGVSAMCGRARSRLPEPWRLREPSARRVAPAKDLGQRVLPPEQAIDSLVELKDNGDLEGVDVDHHER